MNAIEPRIKPGFHVLNDTATRSSVVGYVDHDQKLWLPGSDKAFTSEDVYVNEGDSPRFNYVSEVGIPSGHADWDARYGRFD